MGKYKQITDSFSKFDHPEIFYAFSDKQYKEGAAKLPTGEKIYRGVSGQFGTKNGMVAFDKACADIEERVRTECTPQEVYDYEYDNHECDYTGDDSEAVEIVLSFFSNPTFKGRRR